MTILQFALLLLAIIVGLGAGRILAATATERFFPNPDQVRTRNVRGAMIAGVMLSVIFAIWDFAYYGFNIAVAGAFFGGIALPLSVYVLGTLNKIIKKQLLQRFFHWLIKIITDFFHWCDATGSRLMLWIRAAGVRKN